MNYSEYKIEDWVTDDAFIDYVNGAASQEIELLKNDPKHAENIKEANRILRNISNKRPETSSHKLDQIFAKVNTTIDQKAKPRVKIMNMRWLGVAAAVAAIFIISLPFFMNSENVYNTSIAEQESLKLPDNSVVQLNSVSSISFDKKSWNKNRYLELKGEAFFEVEKGSNFTVKSAQGVVTVLGTKFNIRDRSGFYEVECIEGKVQVALESGATYILLQGDRVFQKGDQQPILEKNVVEAIDWLDKFVEVEDQKMILVLEEVARHFDIEFENTASIETEVYTGFFSTVSLDSAIHQILWPMNVEYEIKDRKVIIK